MSVNLEMEQTPMSGVSKVVEWMIRIVGAVLLFLVGYIHLALLVNMFGLSQMIGKLFLLNGIGAFVAMVWILVSRKWYGWVLGILVSGGAAFAKLEMRRIPGLGQFIMGGFGHGKGKQGFPSGGKPASGQGPHAGPTGSGQFTPGHGTHVGHSLLPVFGNMRTLGPESVGLEIAFVVVAVIAIIIGVYISRSRQMH